MFSYSLGTLSVVVPLLAVRIGYSASQIGLLVAVAAVAQIATRLCMGALVRACADKWFLLMAAVMIAGSCALITLSDALLIFTLAQLVQGMARALFWTSSQTHAVRTSLSPVQGLRNVNLAAGVGALIGPAAAGYFWETSTELPLLVGAATGSLAVIPLLLIIRFPPFAAKNSAVRGKGKRLWRQPGVETACWMNAAAGGWKSLLDSYVPLVLSLAGQPAAVIGILISVANATVLAGSAASGWVRAKGIRASLSMGVLAAGLGLAAAGFFAGWAVAAAAALALSGIGAGILQTVGPAIAAETVHPEERGDALAVTGTFRASALFLVPVGMAGLVTVVPATPALLAAGLLLAAPAAAVWRQGTRGTEDGAADAAPVPH
ncbi:MFS transporter (plasmid) [Arthrobacter crystallopoietes]|nr:MFS transporter [Arthrobacter crystallopoietes]